MYEIGFTYKVEEYGVVTLGAQSEGDADLQAREYIQDTFPDAMNVEIDYVKEIKI